MQERSANTRLQQGKRAPQRPARHAEVPRGTLDGTAVDDMDQRLQSVRVHAPPPENAESGRCCHKPVDGSKARATAAGKSGAGADSCREEAAPDLPAGCCGGVIQWCVIPDA